MTDITGPSPQSSPRRLGDRAIALVLAIVAVLAGLLATIMAANGVPDPTALVKVSDTDAIASLARQIDPDFSLVTGVEHYDGVYYYAIALDPLMSGDAHTLIDQAPYRYGRPMHGWLAAIVSMGQPAAVPWALFLLSLAGLALGGWAVSRLCAAMGVTPWGGLVIAMSPGLLFATTVSTTETMGVAMVAVLMLCWWRRAAWWVVGIVAAVVLLYREQYLVVVVGILAYTAVESMRRRRRPSREDVMMSAALVGAIVVLALWRLAVALRLGEWPAPSEDGNTSAPLVGWREAADYALQLAKWDAGHSQIGTTAPAYLAALAVLVLVSAVAALRLRSPLDTSLLLQVLVTSLLSWRTLVYPHEWLRLPVLTLLLALGVLLVRHPLPRPAPRAQGSP